MMWWASGGETWRPETATPESVRKSDGSGLDVIGDRQRLQRPIAVIWRQKRHQEILGHDKMSADCRKIVRVDSLGKGGKAPTSFIFRRS